MKSLNDYSLTCSDEEYHNNPAWSYSVIAKYAREGFSSLATLHDRTIPTAAMEFGSLFDSFITKGKETLNEYIVDTTGVTCPPAEREVFDRIIELGFGKYCYDNLAGMHPGSLSEIMHSCETFCNKYKKDDTRYAKLAENAGYYELHRTGKKVVSKEDWNDAYEMFHIFRNDPYLKNIFGTKNENGIEYIYQAKFLVPWIIEGKEVSVKIMPDLLVVNHNDKTVQPVDLKTSSMPAYAFSENFIKYRYDIQASLYTDVMERVLSLADGYSDYTVLPYLFTDISRTDKVPVTYEYDPRNGFSYSRGNNFYQYKGWEELLAEILAYEANGAKVPDYITTEGPNDLISILSR